MSAVNVTSFDSHPALRPEGATLIASPDHGFRSRLIAKLPPQSGALLEAHRGAEVLAILDQQTCSLLLLDRHQPDLDAEELRHLIRKRFPLLEIVLVDSRRGASDDERQMQSAHASPSLLTRTTVGEVSGATNGLTSESPYGSTGNVHSYIEASEDRDLDSDLLTKFESDYLPPRIGPYPEVHRGSRPGGFTPHPGTPGSEPLPGMIGSSVAMQSMYRMVRLVAARNTTVLLTGPSGTGKEVVARAIHALSSRSQRPFVVVNCAAIPEALLESELFGHARGAFTGAVQSHSGRILAAQGGTLFLDEIGDMPLSLQAKLLRFLEYKEVQRLGCSEAMKVDVRVVAATNVDLSGLCSRGQFREDLYYRLTCFPVELPALAEHSDDVLALSDHFLTLFSQSAKLARPQLSAAAARRLQSHAWPGNVRELQHVIERALILSEGALVLLPEHLYFPTMGMASGSVASRHR